MFRNEPKNVSCHSESVQNFDSDCSAMINWTDVQCDSILCQLDLWELTEVQNHASRRHYL